MPHDKLELDYLPNAERIFKATFQTAAYRTNPMANLAVSILRLAMFLAGATAIALSWNPYFDDDPNRLTEITFLGGWTLATIAALWWLIFSDNIIAQALREAIAHGVAFFAIIAGALTLGSCGG